jgi:hypothetical protein
LLTLERGQPQVPVAPPNRHLSFIPHDEVVLQSLSALQPQVALGMQMGPGLQVAAQSAQAPPLLPHAKFTVP